MGFLNVIKVKGPLEISHAAVTSRAIAHVSSYLILELESILVHSETVLLIFAFLLPGRFHHLVGIYARLLLALSGLAFFSPGPVSHLLVQRLPDAQFHLFCRLLFGLDLSVNHDLQFLSVHFVPPHVSLLLP